MNGKILIAIEIGELPNPGKSVIRIGGEAHVVDHVDLTPFWKREGKDG